LYYIIGNRIKRAIRRFGSILIPNRRNGSTDPDKTASDNCLPDSYIAQFREFSAMAASNARDEKVTWEDIYPCLTDDTEQTGFDRHYIYHPSWAARVLAKTRPSVHTDIGSSLAFSTMLSAFIPVNFFDLRPAPVVMNNLRTGSVDLVDLDIPDNSIDSLSCMHVIEHIGLGRYGDPLDAMGDIKAINELIRVLAYGGNLLIVVPVGKPMVRFNAHRIYRHSKFLEYFSSLELVEFGLIPDGFAPDGILYNPDQWFIDAQEYGCGCYWFRKNP
jgi:hypothetical protein